MSYSVRLKDSDQCDSSVEPRGWPIRRDCTRGPIRVGAYAFIVVTDGRFAAFAQGAKGFGPAVVQQYVQQTASASGQVSLNQLTAPAQPGVVVTVWGTGLGPLTSGSDADAPPAGTIRNDVTVYVDGIPVTPLYAGRAPGLPGVDQINFTIPPDVRVGCFVPLRIATGSAASGGTTMSITAPSAGPSVCSSEFQLSPAALASLDSRGVVRAACWPGVLLPRRMTVRWPSRPRLGRRNTTRVR